MNRFIRSLKSKTQKKPKYISIDLGTVNTLVYVSGYGIVYNQPSIVAYNTRNNQIIAVGDEAYKMIGKGNKNISIVRPLKEGVIADIKATKTQLLYIFNKLRMLNHIKNSVVLLATPSTITNVEKEALRSTALKLGATYVFVEEEVKMAAIGAGLNIKQHHGQLVVDSGGGTTDIAIIASGDIVRSKSIKIAGNHLNNEIQKYIRTQYSCEIGYKTAERIKINIGSLIEQEAEKPIEIYGRDIVSGLPREIEVQPLEIRKLLQTCINPILDLIVEILEITPPELSGDIFKNGITLCGGTSLLKGFAQYVSQNLKLPAKVGESPLLAVISGTEKFENDVFELIETV